MAIISIAPSMCTAQTVGLMRNILTNRDVVTLANAGFTEAFIVQMISSSRTKFDVTADALADLAKSGLTEEIIQVMRFVANEPKIILEVAAFQPHDNGVATERPFRIFIEESPNSPSGLQSHPQTAEVMKTLGESCPGLTVTNRREQATFIVFVQRESGKWLRRDNKMIVFDRSGNMIYQASKRALGNAVRNFCAANQVNPGLLASSNGRTTMP